MNLALRRPERVVLAAWVIAALGVPLAATWCVGLDAMERGATLADTLPSVVMRTVGDAAARGTVLAALTLALAWPTAFAVQTRWLLAAALIPLSARAYGLLATGMPPGHLSFAITHVAASIPVAALLLQLRLASLPARELEAARELGGSAHAIRRWIVLPHLAPAMGIAALWSICQCMGDVVNGTLAGGGRVYGPGLLVRDALLSDEAPLRVALTATALATAAAVMGVWLVRELLAAHERARDLAPTSRRGRPGDPPRWVGQTVFASTVLPLAGLLRSIGAPRAPRSLQALTDAIPLTTWDALAASTPAVVLAFVFSVLVLERRAAWLGGLALTPIILPSALVGAIASAVARLVGLRPGLALTACAHLVYGVSLAYLLLLLVGASSPPRESEAAADLGAGWLARVRTTWLPALGASAIVAAILVGASVVFDAAIPTFTAGPGGTTLAVVLATLARNGDVASLDMALLISSSLPFAILALFLRRARPTTQERSS